MPFGPVLGNPLLASLLAWPVLLAAPQLFSEERFHVPLGERQLFVNQVGTQQIDQLARTLHQPRIKEALIRPDKFQGEEAIQVRGAPVWDSQERLYKYSLSGTTNPYLTSLDGLHWTAHVLPRSIGAFP